MVKISKEKESEAKRVNANRKKVLQLNDHLNEVESKLGSEEVFSTEWIDYALARHLELDPDLKYLLMIKGFWDLTSAMISGFRDLTTAIVERFQALEDGLYKFIKTLDVRENTTEEKEYKGEPRV